MSVNWIPTIEAESANGTREVSLKTRHLSERKIFIEGTIDFEMANTFLVQMLYLQENGNEPITIFVNSYGGEVNAGLMIYDLIQGCRVKVNIVCVGIAASMAALLLAGGHNGRRYILKHSKVMIHEPLLDRGLGGSATSIKNISDSIIETKNLLNGILAKHTKKTIEEVDKATAFDNYMNAKEAIEFGLCDEIIENMYQLSAIQHY